MALLSKPLLVRGAVVSLFTLPIVLSFTNCAPSLKNMDLGEVELASATDGTPETSSPDPITGSSGTTAPVVSTKSCQDDLYQVVNRNLALQAVDANLCGNIYIGLTAESCTAGRMLKLKLVSGDSCAVEIRGKNEYPYDPKNFFGVASESTQCVVTTGNTIKSAECSSVPTNEREWTVEKTATGQTRFVAADKRCLNLSKQGVYSLGACEAASDFVLPLEGVNQDALPAKEASIDFSKDLFPYIYPKHAVNVVGFTYRNETSPVLAQTAATASMEFVLNPAQTGFYVLELRYGTAFDGAGLRISQDNVVIKTLDLPNTGAHRLFRQGPGFLLYLEAGKTSRLKMEAVNKLPINLLSMTVSGVMTNPLANFGKITAVSASGVTNIPADQIVSAFRISTVKNSQGQVSWPCHWTHCSVDYEVNVLEAGTYNLQAMYSNEVNNGNEIYGKQIWIDDVFYDYMIVPSSGGLQNLIKSKDGLALRLTKGHHVIRVHHIGSYNGTLYIPAVGFGDLELTRIQ